MSFDVLGCCDTREKAKADFEIRIEAERSAMQDAQRVARADVFGRTILLQMVNVVGFREWSWLG